MSASYRDRPVRIRIEDVTIGYGAHPVQSGISAEIRAGEIFAIVGDSGSGKSTLLKAMIGLLRPQSGHIAIEVHPNDAPHDGAPIFGVLFQGGALWTSMSVLDNVMLPMILHRYAHPHARRALARFKLALVGLAGAEERYPSSLSGGMRKRAALARALALDPCVLFLDEPSAGLDPLSSRRLDELILSLRAGLGITIVLVTHELESLHSVADRMLFLDGATHRPIALGAPAELARSAPSAKVREFLTPRPPNERTATELETEALT
jgi:phospholipid/cholesterol/gamma-HCH transport system ATP-binding protein